MMTVRFPNGQAVRYNTANYALRTNSGYTDLYVCKDGDWIAQVPNGCIIESVAACRVYDAVRESAAESTLRSLERDVRAIKRRIPAKRRKT